MDFGSIFDIFLAFDWSFGFWVAFCLFGRFWVYVWRLVRYLAFGKIFSFLDDFWLFGQFLSFELIFGFWVSSWLLGRFFVDFWPLGRFLDCGTIFGFLNDFWLF